MNIEPIIIPIDERLHSAGDSYSIKGHIDAHEYSLGDHEFSCPSGFDWEINLTNSGDGILASGIVRADVIGTCDRCLEEAFVNIASEINEYYLFKLPEKSMRDENEEDEDFALVSEDSTIDISGAINDAIVLETPFVVLCSDDCKGLCPKCGANLNEGPCNCAQDDVDPMNPFAALKDLDL